MSRALQYRSFGYDVLQRILRKQREVPGSLPQAVEKSVQVEAPQFPRVGVETRDPSYYAERVGGATWKTSSTGRNDSSYGIQVTALTSTAASLQHEI